jgi:pyruvate carboxylase
LLVLDILRTEKSRVRDRFISYSKYSRRGTLFIQKKVASALTETENWDLLVDCTSRDGRQMLDAHIANEDAHTVSKTVQNILPNRFCFYKW